MRKSHKVLGKLNLSRQTVAVLHRDALELVAGGASSGGSGHDSCADDNGCHLTYAASKAMQYYTCWTY